MSLLSWWREAMDEARKLEAARRADEQRARELQPHCRTCGTPMTHPPECQRCGTVLGNYERARRLGEIAEAEGRARFDL